MFLNPSRLLSLALLALALALGAGGSGPPLKNGRATSAPDRPASARTHQVRGEVLDAETGKPLPCRVYIQGGDGSWYFPKPESPSGSAVEDRKSTRLNSSHRTI